LSGGLDSATVLAIARQECGECHAISFDYGQRGRHELECARRIAESMSVMDHHVVEIPLGLWGGSSLTDSSMTVPKSDPAEQEATHIPNTYVPARNTIFLSYALAFAEAAELDRIYAGMSSVDYSGYPDCRPEYVEAFQRLASLATKRGVEGNPVEIRVPLLHMTKADAVRKGLELGVDYSMTQSCYDPDETGRACGTCESCRLRLEAFREAGATDPVGYV
jgi:7-cyano-7-deazaguanine synthase